MVAFFAGGFAAVLSSTVLRPPFRFALLALGVINLVLLASYFTLGDGNPLWALGVGGAERWVAYPEILWMLGFGGYLAGSAEAAGQPGT
jgi:bacteriorhodopsin